ncbi:cation:dicarboxylase symporter family transporter [Bradyrhizobium sediminis]|uniref:Cation:dicarboxylase symporter family transporter n=1 Tax=Bradyrhizobium sediminis TaxID=2840469 RepID=A0A975RUW7_9BRAD|nr:cation:dicarboxylase symporter family transporter [Bradyrhizobium sediminis]
MQERPAERRILEGGPVVAARHATRVRIKAPGDGFIKPIRRVIAPIVLCAVVSGIAHIQDARTVGRIGVTALIHLEIVSTFALGFGPVAGNLARPGAGFGGATADAEANQYLLN